MLLGVVCHHFPQVVDAVKKYLASNILNFVVLALIAVYVARYWHQLPATIPVHFNIDGEPDRWAPKSWGQFQLLFVNLLYLLFLPLLLKMSPKGYNLEGAEDDLARLNLAITALLGGLQIAILWSTMDPANYPMSVGLGLALGMFMILLGNHLGRIGRNFFVGIRLPWTIVSEQNWRLTHRFAGRLYVVAGLVTLAATWLGGPFWVAIAALFLASALPVGYSWNLWRRGEGAA